MAVVVVPDEPTEVLVPGCESASAVSQAVCKAGATLMQRPLYEHIAVCHAQPVSSTQLSLFTLYYFSSGQTAKAAFTMFMLLLYLIRLHIIHFSA